MFRKTLFWIHLIAGVITGLVIALMSATGVALAFEKELLAWAEKDAQVVAVPSEASARIPLDDLLKRFRSENPEARPSAVTVSSKLDAAVAITVGRDAVYYINPYTGEIRRPASTAMRDALRKAEDAHRWLALEGDGRTTGRAITGASNLAFLVLGVTGLYLWWPRQFTWRALRPSIWFVGGAKAKAREWNWHNTIGFWTLPVLIVLTASGVVMSYRWANNLVYRFAGEAPPAIGGPGGPAGNAGGGAIEFPAPAAGARPASYATHLATLEQTLPNWQTITFRMAANRPNAPRAGSRSANSDTPQAGGPRSANADTPRRGSERRSVSPVTAMVRSQNEFPSFASTTVTLDPYTSAVLKKESLADATPGRRARMWLRFLHTGEALGMTGKILAALASLGGVFLVYTGFAMAIRRAANARRRRAAARGAV
ncbi:MAG TPA: PepSY-associated TM helix domain-containing protein [Opitutaceae bacterium]|nr:PepSY-associated TM helix domain-containing protein [Opitutaceae bacterium]